MLEQGDIVLIPVPFTDLSSQKRRPVIVISNNAYNRKTRDIVVVAVTSNPEEVDYSFTITSSDLEKARSNAKSNPRRQNLHAFTIYRCAKFWASENRNVGSCSENFARLNF